MTQTRRNALLGASLFALLLVMGGCGGESDTRAAGGPAVMELSESGCPVKPDLEGEVVEAFDVSRYTYLRLKTDAGDAWAAVMQSEVELGEKVRVVHPIVIKNFTSPSTGMSFERLSMGTLVRQDQALSPAGGCPWIGSGERKIAI